MLLLYTRSGRSLDFQIALFFFLLMSLPVLRQKIPGFPGINFLFMMSWPSLLSIALLVPLLFQMNRSETGERIKSTGIDKLVFIYFCYLSLLSFRDTTVTDGLRGVFDLFIGIYVPYFAVSRCIRSEQDFNRIGHAIYSIMLFMALVGIFSSVNYWNLYQSFQRELGIIGGDGYIQRGGALRAGAVFGAIHFGTLLGIAIAIAILFFQRLQIPTRILALHIVILLAALFVTYSRGPWVGVSVMLLTFLLFASNRGKLISRASPLFVLVVLALLVTDIDTKILNLLPFIGTESVGNVTYREDLFFISIQEINDHPFFGSTDFLDSPRMQELIQGEGIIDLVNTYIQIGLHYGYVGVFLFCAILFGLLRAMISLRKKLRKNGLQKLLEQGVVMISICVLIATVIATVSSIGNKQVSTIIWAVFGLFAAYVRISHREIAHASS